MNSTIRFSDEGLFRLALTALELDATPEYVISGLSIETNQVEEIIAILHDNGIFMFEVEGFDPEHVPGEDMDGDFDSGMASVGMGTDEDYGYFGGNDE